MTTIVEVKIKHNASSSPVLVQKVERLEDRSVIKETYMLREGNSISLTIYGAEEVRVTERP